VGGHVPFFKEGDSWPTNKDGRPLAFIMQFVDPRPGKNELVQLFMDDIYDDSGNLPCVYFRRLNLTQPLTHVRIPEPENIVKNEDKNTGEPIYGKAQRITGWLVRDEPPSSEFIYSLIKPVYWPNIQGIGDYAEYDRIFDQVYRQIVADPENMEKTYKMLKIDGYGDSVQGIEYTEFIHNLFNGHYGDSGVLHISEDGIVNGDMA